MVEQDGYGACVGGIEPCVELLIEFHLVVVQDHGRSLHAQAPADLNTLIHVQTEVFCLRGKSEHLRVRVLQGKVHLNILNNTYTMEINSSKVAASTQGRCRREGMKYNRSVLSQAHVECIVPAVNWGQLMRLL